jgi:hypothetical protein
MERFLANQISSPLMGEDEGKGENDLDNFRVNYLWKRKCGVAVLTQPQEGEFEKLGAGDPEATEVGEGPHPGQAFG